MTYRRKQRESKRLKILMYRTMTDEVKTFLDTGVEDCSMSDMFYRRWVRSIGMLVR